MESRALIMTNEIFNDFMSPEYSTDELKTILGNVLENIYEPDRFYPKHIVGITPLTRERMIEIERNPNTHIKWNHVLTPTKPQMILLNISASDETIIWDLLHEYGHLVDGPPSSEEGNRLREHDREKRAWDNGKKELKDYPQFHASYDKRADECLSSYPK